MHFRDLACQQHLLAVADKGVQISLIGIARLDALDAGRLGIERDHHFAVEQQPREIAEPAADLHDPLPEQQSRYDIASTGLGARVTLGKYFYGTYDLAWPLTDTAQTRAGDVRNTFRLWAQYP